MENNREQSGENKTIYQISKNKMKAYYKVTYVIFFIIALYADLTDAKSGTVIFYCTVALSQLLLLIREDLHEISAELKTKSHIESNIEA